ncbi:MAG: RlmE family RNA methyltransferase, partial [Burkholderiaceae bacterium]
YVRQAQQKGYRSRAAFKLLEIDEKDRLIRPGMTVLDLGAAPGSWSQVVRERLAYKSAPPRQSGDPSAEGRDPPWDARPPGIRGRVLALDLLPMEPIADVVVLQGDFREEAIAQLLAQQLNGEGIDLVLSDMAPNLSGVGVADAARVMHLGELALEFAARYLKPNGALLIKTFQGSGYSQLVEQFKKVFKTVAPRKPGASRAESSEVFLLGRDIKNQLLKGETKD